MQLPDLSSFRDRMHAAADNVSRAEVVEEYEAVLDADETVELPAECYEFLDELWFLSAALDPAVQEAVRLAYARQVALGHAPVSELDFRRGYVNRRGSQNPPDADRIGGGTDAERSEAHGYFVALAEQETDPMQRAATEWYGAAGWRNEDARSAFITGWKNFLAGKKQPKAANRLSRARFYGHAAAQQHFTQETER
jgi:hypothetical protein